jgi:(2R)-sulfolactate sulfo-lyase subunit alpha
MEDMHPDFLAHVDGDAVAVAVRDVDPGPARVNYLDERAPETVEVKSPVPLGHKVALKDVPVGADVIEYGLRVGIASAEITRGDYVHTHNVRSARWQTSVA